MPVWPRRIFTKPSLNWCIHPRIFCSFPPA